MCQNLEKVQRGIQEENRLAGKQRDEFMRQLSEQAREFQGDGSKLMNTFQRWGGPHDSEFRGGGRGDQHPDLHAADVTEDVLRLLARLEQQADSNMIDATTRHSYGDRKSLAKEQAKKIAIGHKADDHEEGQKMN